MPTTKYKNITAADLIPNVTKVNTIFDGQNDWSIYTSMEPFEINNNGQVIHQGQMAWSETNADDDSNPPNLTPVSVLTVVWLQRTRIRVLPWMLKSPTNDTPVGAVYNVTMGQIRKIENP